MSGRTVIVQPDQQRVIIYAEGLTSGQLERDLANLVTLNTVQDIVATKNFISDPTFNDDAIPQSKVVGLVTLSGRVGAIEAAEANEVTLDTAQIITGAKTFTAKPTIHQTIGGGTNSADLILKTNTGENASLGLAVPDRSPYGALTPSSLFLYNANAGGIVLMADSANGDIRLAAGGSAEKVRVTSLVMQMSVPISPKTADTIGLIIKGMAGQSADHLQVQSFSGSVLTSIAAGGKVYANAGAHVGGNDTLNAGTLGVEPLSASAVGIYLRGRTGQTADLLNVQDVAGNVLARVTATGVGSFAAGSTVGGSGLVTLDTAQTVTAQKTLIPATPNIPALVFGPWYFADGAIKIRNLNNRGTGTDVWTEIGGMSAVGIFRAQGPSVIGLIVQGYAAQTGDFQQWQNSAGTALVLITAGGDQEFTASTRGPIVRSPNGTRYRVGVDNTGRLITTAM